jgi:signal transduction histidine kinase/CheY-like chemotaxis protein
VSIEEAPSATAASLLQAIDWDATPIGPRASWSRAFTTTLELMLSSRHPMCLGWGKDLTFFYNDAYAPFLGARHPSAMGRPFGEVWSDVWPDIEPLLRQALSGEATWSEDLPLLMTRNGYPEDTWWSFSYSPVRDDDGAIAGVLDVCTDSTAKVLSQRRKSFLLAFSDQIRNLVDPIDITNAASEVLGAHLGVSRAGYGEVDAAVEHVRIDRDWTDGSVLSLGGQNRRLDGFGPMVADTLREGRILRIDDVTSDPRSAAYAATYGSLVARALLVVPLIRGGRLRSVFYLHDANARTWKPEDATLALDVATRTWEAVERARAEAELREFAQTLETRVTERTEQLLAAEAALRQSQKLEAMGQLTGGVAHDFNNLLTPIVGSLDLLQRRGLGEREQRLVENALQSAERATTLVQRLLAFARQQPLKTGPIDIAGLVQGLGTLLGSIIGPKIELTCVCDADLPEAMADPHQLEMALINLCVNARDAMPDGGRLQIRASVERSAESGDLTAGDYVRLAVIDTGCGMDEAMIARAVEPFFSTKGVGKGTGLGLSMAHGLASQLGGALRIDSQVGAGTTVALWLPVAEAGATVQDDEAGLPILVRLAGRALLVDDEALVRSTTSEILSELGYDVVEFASAEEALDHVDRGEPFDLLVTDHLMPGMNGADLAMRLRQIAPLSRAVVVSGSEEVELHVEGVARLVKPFRPSELAASIAQLVG